MSLHNPTHYITEIIGTMSGVMIEVTAVKIQHALNKIAISEEAYSSRKFKIMRALT